VCVLSVLVGVVWLVWKRIWETRVRSERQAAQAVGNVLMHSRQL
jgi:hypothetical protein